MGRPVIFRQRPLVTAVDRGGSEPPARVYRATYFVLHPFITPRVVWASRDVRRRLPASPEGGITASSRASTQPMGWIASGMPARTPDHNRLLRGVHIWFSIFGVLGPLGAWGLWHLSLCDDSSLARSLGDCLLLNLCSTSLRVRGSNLGDRAPRGGVDKRSHSGALALLSCHRARRRVEPPPA